MFPLLMLYVGFKVSCTAFGGNNHTFVVYCDVSQNVLKKHCNKSKVLKILSKLGLSLMPPSVIAKDNRSASVLILLIDADATVLFGLFVMLTNCVIRNEISKDLQLDK